MWWRYSDNAFAVWTYGEPALQLFLDSLNHYHTIKFTFIWSAEEFTFLHVRIYLRNSLIKIDLCVIATDTYWYIHSDIYHSKDRNTAFFYSQALCLCRICSEEDNL